MILAEALNLRADLKTRISQLSERLYVNSKVQEGEKPAEDPQKLLKELDEDITQYEELIRRINHTNCVTLKDGVSLTDMIAKRDALALKSSIWRTFLQKASDKIDRYSKSEIRIKSTVDVAEMQQKVDDISKQIRELDTTIQGLNWTTEMQ